MTVVSLGELSVSNDAAIILGCLGLGSCVGVAAYDPIAHIGGMVHVVLPTSQGRPSPDPGRYADTAIPALMQGLRAAGAIQSRLVIKIAGGAQMSQAPGSQQLFKVGPENIEAVTQSLTGNGLRIASTDLGGRLGRTFRLHIDTGNVTVTQVGLGTKQI